ncbi:hypothetical protein B0H13DRAFT_2340445 [Mycena leptocephala]|nr:hypothetical protein B0H13DRAFT_2340445 [Mycena leptocephala]
MSTEEDAIGILAAVLVAFPNSCLQLSLLPFLAAFKGTPSSGPLVALVLVPAPGRLVTLNGTLRVFTNLYQIPRPHSVYQRKMVHKPRPPLVVRRRHNTHHFLRHPAPIRIRIILRLVRIHMPISRQATSERKER